MDSGFEKVTGTSKDFVRGISHRGKSWDDKSR